MHLSSIKATPMISKEFILSRTDGRYLCPICEGGSSREKSLNIWSDGYYAIAKCHRASCGAFAKIPEFGRYRDRGIPEKASLKPSPELLSPYAGDMYPLSNYPNVLKRFRELYGFDGKGVYTVTYGTANPPLIIPILDPNGQVRGHVVKTGLFPREQKSNRIYKAKHEPMISWSPSYKFSYEDDDSVTLVEDQISALKYTLAGRGRAVALLGTSLNMESVAEIQRVADHVTIALDADATVQAFRLARRWGSAFKSCQVKILERDIKNDSQYNQVHPTVSPGSVSIIDSHSFRHNPSFDSGSFISYNYRGNHNPLC